MVVLDDLWMIMYTCNDRTVSQRVHWFNVKGWLGPPSYKMGKNVSLLVFYVSFSRVQTLARASKGDYVREMILERLSAVCK